MGGQSPIQVFTDQLTLSQPEGGGGTSGGDEASKPQNQNPVDTQSLRRDRGNQSSVHYV